MAHLARRYTQDVAMAADDGDRCRGHRGRNLFARAARSLEWIEGASDKSQRGLACRRRPALPPRGLNSRDAASRVDVSGKTARIAWAVMLREKEYQPRAVAA